MATADRAPPAAAQAAPEVSVVVPCHNASRWIAGTLASVFSQGCVALEVIVVDDGSSDDTVAVVRQQFPAARVLRQANAGVAAARNAGLQAARGRWVAFIDADDHWLPGKLHTQLQLLASQPQARLCCAPWHVWTSDEPTAPPHWRVGSVPPESPVAGTGGQGWIYPELLLGCTVWTSTVVADHALLLELGGFDPGLKVGEDFDLWLRASRVTPFVRAPQPLALYRQHPGSLTKQPPAQNYEGVVLQRALARWGLRGPDGRLADARAVHASLARTWHTYGAAHLQRAAVRPALRAASRALQADWRHWPAWKLAVKAALTGLRLVPPAVPSPKPTLP